VETPLFRGVSFFAALLAAGAARDRRRPPVFPIAADAGQHPGVGARLASTSDLPEPGRRCAAGGARRHPGDPAPARPSMPWPWYASRQMSARAAGSILASSRREHADQGVARQIRVPGCRGAPVDQWTIAMPVAWPDWRLPPQFRGMEPPMVGFSLHFQPFRCIEASGPALTTFPCPAGHGPATLVWSNHGYCDP
jgi:hypothetical protein